MIVSKEKEIEMQWQREWIEEILEDGNEVDWRTDREGT